LMSEHAPQVNNSTVGVSWTIT